MSDGEVIVIVGADKNYAYAVANAFPHCTILNLIRDRRVLYLFCS